VKLELNDKYIDTKMLLARIQSARTGIPTMTISLRIERLSGANKNEMVSSDVSAWLMKTFRRNEV
jgi:predicted Co/Zn/Cd cation transporter (cation efflux family)